MRIAREKQIEDIRKQQAIELEREKQDFFKVVEVQKSLLQVNTTHLHLSRLSITFFINTLYRKN